MAVIRSDTMEGSAHWRDVLDHTDAATAELIIHLQFEDLNNLGRDSDNDLNLGAALAAFEEELRHSHAVRQCIGGDAITPLLPTSLQAKKRARSNSDPSQADEGTGPGAKRVKVEQPADVERGVCSACSDDLTLNQLWTSACDHAYCADCLEQLYRLAMTDESVYPPSCCQRSFVYQTVRPRLPAELVEEFEAKREELEIKDRIYCADPHCSAYISIAERRDGGASCAKCSRVTCVQCKGLVHDGECPPNEALTAVLALAGREEWQRCPTCCSMIELNHGCNHITYV
ncbi:hypothetical protein LTR78_006084 [Recurvomyces mirabilis]|uniref:RBR-type E3 ubiquitin transferase n=2 Tax=Recurvomyces mirabilis TaxID=574656 RepID=A0AAE1C098_9PEZI|nr:hypothetical protein LTR78_006084 [Recurvomyces mirabilis]